MFQRGIAATLHGLCNIHVAFKTTSFSFHGTTSLCADHSTNELITINQFSNKRIYTTINHNHTYTPQFRHAEQVQAINSVIHNDVHPCKLIAGVQYLVNL